MGFLDDAKKAINKNAEKIDEGLEKASELAKKKTGGKYDDQIDKVTDAAQDRTGKL